MLSAVAYRTTAQAAEFLSVDQGKIGDLIRAGELVAVNVAVRGTGRPRWRVSSEALAAFLLRRQSQAPAPQVRRRRKSAPAKEFV